MTNDRPLCRRGPGENIDEVYARISYVDCHIGPARQTFDTGLIVRDFSNHGQ